MSDTASHGAPQPDPGELRHTLSIHDVERELVAAGVPRSHRQVIRYCETGMLEAVKVPGPTGAQWYVSPASLPKAIGDLRQWEAQRASRTTPHHAMASNVSPTNAQQNNSAAPSHSPHHPATTVSSPPGSSNQNTKSDEARHAAPQSDAPRHNQDNGAPEVVTSRYVSLLEQDNEFLRDQVKKKDEQITDLSKRFGETQTLLGAMQRMLAPLLGQADPFGSSKKSEGEPAA